MKMPFEHKIYAGPETELSTGAMKRRRPLIKMGS